MRIHETRRKRCIAQVDYLRIARDWQIASRIDNLITLHEDHTVLREDVRFAIKESRRFQRGGLIGTMRRDIEAQENYKDTRRDFHSARLKAIRHAGKKGIGPRSDLVPITC
jgi:hypothetical protein